MRRTIRRLMLVTDAHSFGGAERYVLDMAVAARRRGVEASICWLPWLPATGEMFQAAAKIGIPLFASSVAEAPGAWRGVRRFSGALASARPDALIVNASGRPGFWRVCWRAWLAGIPVAWVHHMVEQRDPRRIAPQWFGGTVEGPQWWRVPQALRHRLAAEASVAVIVSNAADRERVARAHGVRRPAIQVISPGVDCARFRCDPAAGGELRRQWGIEQKAFVVGTAARLVGRKGIEPLIEATAMLRAGGVPVVTVIAGDGPRRESFRELAVRLGVGEAVRFAGFIENMVAFHSALDAFALCSETESFGLVLAEAMACGRAVAATPTSGARVQIQHMVNGWQLGGFTAGELARALTALHESPSLRERLGGAARPAVESAFSIDLTLERTLRALGV